MKPQEVDDVSKIDLKFWFEGKSEEPEEDKGIQPIPSVHEQEDGIILAVCATGTSSRDSLLSWIRLLQESNPHLEKLTILFTQSSPLGEVMVVDTHTTAEQMAI